LALSLILSALLWKLVVETFLPLLMLFVFHR